VDYGNFFEVGYVIFYKTNSSKKRFACGENQSLKIFCKLYYLYHLLKGLKSKMLSQTYEINAFIAKNKRAFSEHFGQLRFTNALSRKFDRKY